VKLKKTAHPGRWAEKPQQRDISSSDYTPKLNARDADLPLAPTKIVPPGFRVRFLSHIFFTTRYRALVVRCPFCHSRHLHGWDPDIQDSGTRVAHCWGGIYKFDFITDGGGTL